MADVMDLMYEDVGSQIEEMKDITRTEQQAKDARQADRDAQKAEADRVAAEKEEVAAEADRELLARPLERNTGEHGPGSSAQVACKTLVSSKITKRKELEAMTPEQRDAADEKRKESARKGKATKARKKLRRAKDAEAEANRKPALPDMNVIVDSIAEAVKQREEIEFLHDREDELREIDARIVHLEEQRVLKQKELDAHAVAAGAGTIEGMDETGVLWKPEYVWLPADLKYAETGTDFMNPDAAPGLRDAIREAQQVLVCLKKKEDKDAITIAAVEKQSARYREELKRRLHESKSYKEDQKKKDKELKLTQARKNAIDDPFQPQKYLSANDMKSWWPHYGYPQALRKLNPKSTQAIESIWTPEPPQDDDLPAQVETEEM